MPYRHQLLASWCANEACGNREDEHSAGTYKSCAKCSSSFYCSRECQAAGWKADHKKSCGQVRNEQLLPSQIAANEVMNKMLKQTGSMLRLNQALFRS